MKKLNNKGFSLVELIIVIAIMAVLIGVLAPQFLRYVERSRYQKDMTAMEEARKATEIAIGVEAIARDVQTALASGTVQIVYTTAGVGTPSGVTTLDNELNDALGGSIDLDFSSRAYTTAASAITIDVTAAGATGLTVTATAVDELGGPLTW